MTRPKLRKVNTKKRKKDRRDAQERLEKQTAGFLNHPKECCVCKKAFERTREAIREWHVVIREDKVRLACPRCWSMVEEALEKKE